MVLRPLDRQRVLATAEQRTLIQGEWIDLYSDEDESSDIESEPSAQLAELVLDLAEGAATSSTAEDARAAIRTAHERLFDAERSSFRTFFAPNSKDPNQPSMEWNPSPESIGEVLAENRNRPELIAEIVSGTDRWMLLKEVFRSVSELGDLPEVTFKAWNRAPTHQWTLDWHSVIAVVSLLLKRSPTSHGPGRTSLEALRRLILDLGPDEVRAQMTAAEDQALVAWDWERKLESVERHIDNRRYREAQYLDLASVASDSSVPEEARDRADAYRFLVYSQEGPGTNLWWQQQTARADARRGQRVAQIILDTARQVDAGKAEESAWGLLGFALELDDNPRAAEEVFRRAVENGSRDPCTFDRLSLLLLRSKRFDQVVATLDLYLTRVETTNARLHATLLKRHQNAAAKLGRRRRYSGDHAVALPDSAPIAELWSVPLRGIPLLATDDYVVTAFEDSLYRLDIRDGATIASYEVPTSGSDFVHKWHLADDGAALCVFRGKRAIRFIDPKWQESRTVVVDRPVRAITYAGSEWVAELAYSGELQWFTLDGVQGSTVSIGTTISLFMSHTENDIILFNAGALTRMTKTGQVVWKHRFRDWPMTECRDLSTRAGNSIILMSSGEVFVFGPDGTLVREVSAHEMSLPSHVAPVRNSVAVSDRSRVILINETNERTHAFHTFGTVEGMLSNGEKLLIGTTKGIAATAFL